MRMFVSLREYNYRVWAAGALVSNIGTWMQRTAQDWVVLTELTDHDATSVGIVMGLQFGPQLLMLPFTGYAADRFERRKLLLVTQALMGILGLLFGVLALTGLLQLWHVYGLALALGCVTAVDAPARQSFVSDLVPESVLPNAVALNSTSFNSGRLIGPAVAGVVIAGIGSGWAFILNALSFAAVIGALSRLRPEQMRQHERPIGKRSRMLDGLRYVWTRPELRTALMMLFIIGTFGLNFPIFISTMTVSTFHLGSQQYGLLSSIMAAGSVSGALVAAGRGRPDMRRLTLAAGLFGVACAAAACMPDVWLFATVLVLVGICAQTFTTSTNSLLQLSTDPSMRGRVMAIMLAIGLGGTPLGAPCVGWIADHLGPRWAMGVGALAGLAAALFGWRSQRKAGNAVQ